MSVQKGGINLSAGEYSMYFPFVNFVTFANRPLPSSTSKISRYLDLTALGFPTNTTVGADLQIYARGDSNLGSVGYVVKWRGKASYSHVSYGTTTGASRTRNGVTWNSASQSTLVNDGRMTFTLSGATAYISAITIKGDNTDSGADQFTELVICRADEEDYYDDQRFAGVKPQLIYSPYLVTELQDGGWSSLRFMEPQNTNTSVLANWSDRPSVDQFTMHVNRFINWLNDGTTEGRIANTGDVYTASYATGSGSYVHGENYSGVPAASNTTTTPTLNINSRGAKNILMGMSNPPGAPVTSGTNNQTRMIADREYNYVYDANFDAWIARPAGITSGWSMESMIGLCNATGIPGWFCVPVYASDDYVTQLANLLNSTHVPTPIRIEYGNEIWNIALGYEITSRIEKAGLVHFSGPQVASGAAAWSAGYGLRFRQIEQIMRPVLGSNLKMILASQGSNGDSLANLTNLVENQRFQNTNYAEISGSNAPILFADAVSYALYFRANSVVGDAGDVGWSSVTQAATLKTHVDNFFADNSRTDGFDWMKSAFLADSTFTTPLSATGRFGNWNALAATYGKQVEMYELNHQFDGPSSTFTAANAPWNDASYGDTFSGSTKTAYGKINNFLIAFLASQQYKDVWTTLLTSYYGYQRSLSAAFFPLVGGTPFHSHAQLTPTLNAGVITGTPFSNYTACKAWNNKTTRTFILKN